MRVWARAAASTHLPIRMGRAASTALGHARARARRLWVAEPAALLVGLLQCVESERAEERLERTQPFLCVAATPKSQPQVNSTPTKQRDGTCLGHEVERAHFEREAQLIGRRRLGRTLLRQGLQVGPQPDGVPLPSPLLHAAAHGTQKDAGAEPSGMECALSMRRCASVHCGFERARSARRAIGRARVAVPPYCGQPRCRNG